MERTPRGVWVEWRDWGDPTHPLGVTEFGRMLGNDPNMALSVLYGLGRWEAGRSGWGIDPQRRDWVRVGEERGESSSSRQSSINSSTSGERTPTAKPPPPRPEAPNQHTKPRHAESSHEEPHPPTPHPKPKAKAKGKAKPPLKPQPPPLENRGQEPYANVPGVGDTRYVPWAEGGIGGTVSQVTVLGGWG